MSYGDNPIDTPRQDRLNRAAVVEALARFVSRPDLDTPMTVGIYGEWGSGKTSVMRMLENHLSQRKRTVWFDAWRYGTDADALWRAFVTKVCSGLRKTYAQEGDQEVDDLIDNLYRARHVTERGDLRVNWRAALPFAAQAVLSFVPGIGQGVSTLTKSLKDRDELKEWFELVQREEKERYEAQIASLEQFQAQLRSLVDSRIVQNEQRLFMFVDDLDRCLAGAAVTMLEAIKVFFDAKGCVFILGLDRGIVEAGVREHHPTMSESDAGEYLDKIIQVPFNLPPLNESQMKGFIEKWCDEHREAELKEQAGLIATGVAPNPRKVKRTLNVLSLAYALRKEGGLAVDEETRHALAKIVVIQNSYEAIYREALENPQYLATLETSAHQGDAADVFERVPRLAEMLRMGWAFTQRNQEELIDLLFLTRFSDANAGARSGAP
jgi:hypothetical protein